MGFSFSGAMRGLGAGLVNSGALLEKFNERKFEEEQLKIKLDREEHMQRLQMQHAENLQKSGQEFTANENLLNRQQQAEQFKTTSGFEQQRIDLAKEEAKANAAERAANAQYRMASLKAQIDASNKESDQMKLMREREDLANKVVQSQYPDDPDKQNLAKYALLYGADKQEKALSSASIDAGVSSLETFKNTDGYESGLETFQREHKGATAMDYDAALVTGFAEKFQNRGVSPTGSSTESSPPKETYNFSQLFKDATEGKGNVRTIAIEKITAAALSPKYKDNKQIQEAYQRMKMLNTPEEVDTSSSNFRTSGTYFSE